MLKHCCRAAVPDVAGFHRLHHCTCTTQWQLWANSPFKPSNSTTSISAGMSWENFKKEKKKNQRAKYIGIWYITGSLKITVWENPKHACGCLGGPLALQLGRWRPLGRQVLVPRYWPLSESWHNWHSLRKIFYSTELTLPNGNIIRNVLFSFNHMWWCARWKDTNVLARALDAYRARSAGTWLPAPSSGTTTWSINTGILRGYHLCKGNHPLYSNFKSPIILPVGSS